MKCKKSLSDYLKIDYPVSIHRMPDGCFCAEVMAIPGLCAYGSSARDALEVLQGVKCTAISLMLEQGKEVPVPTIHVEIPVDRFNKMPNRKILESFVVA